MRQEHGRRSKNNNGVKFGEIKLREIVKKAPQFKKEIQSVIEDKRGVIESGANEMKKVYQYLRTNWKVVLPAIALLGIRTSLKSMGNFNLSQKIDG